MRKLIFSPNIRRIIRRFIVRRIAYFKRLYSDTGIFGEDMIVERYIRESRELFDLFMSAIQHDLNLGVMGNIYKKEGNDEFSRLVVRAGSHILIVWLRYDRQNEEVLVEDLEIQT